MSTQTTIDTVRPNYRLYESCGEYSDPLPKCEANASGEHDWRAPHSLVGGLSENPWVLSLGGTIIASKKVCACCGCYMTPTDKGSQCHQSEARVEIEIAERDEASEEWLKMIHQEDGWLPDWLADFLACPPTVRMDDADAYQWVAEHADDAERDEADLEHAFAAMFGRRADDQDRIEGLWSHLNAAV